MAKSLKRHGFDAEAMHGDLDQKLRMTILQRFRDGELKLLIASDVAARGLDIPSVSHIFNFDVPIHSEDYVHRIGRTGRAGRSGKSLTLCLPPEEKYLGKIEELVEKAIPVMESPLKSGDAPAPTPHEAGSERRRSSERRRGDGRARTSAPVAVVQEPVEPVAAEPVESRQETPPEAREQRRENRGEHRHDSADRRRGGRSGREERVLGMGDHVPAFLLRDFRIESGIVDEASEPEELPAIADAAPVEAPAPVAEAPAADPTPALEAAAPEASVADPAPSAVETAAPDAAEAAAVDAGAAAPEAGAPEEAEAAAGKKPAKPRRRRTTKAAPAEAAAPAA